MGNSCACLFNPTTNNGKRGGTKAHTDKDQFLSRSRASKECKQDYIVLTISKVEGQMVLDDEITKEPNDK
jgi:hypothetical protein